MQKLYYVIKGLVCVKIQREITLEMIFLACKATLLWTVHSCCNTGTALNALMQIIQFCSLQTHVCT